MKGAVLIGRCRLPRAAAIEREYPRRGSGARQQRACGGVRLKLNLERDLYATNDFVWNDGVDLRSGNVGQRCRDAVECDGRAGKLRHQLAGGSIDPARHTGSESKQESPNRDKLARCNALPPLAEFTMPLTMMEGVAALTMSVTDIGLRAVRGRSGCNRSSRYRFALRVPAVLMPSVSVTGCRAGGWNTASHGLLELAEADY